MVSSRAILDNPRCIHPQISNQTCPRAFRFLNPGFIPRRIPLVSLMWKWMLRSSFKVGCHIVTKVVTNRAQKTEVVNAQPFKLMKGDIAPLASTIALLSNRHEFYFSTSRRTTSRLFTFVAAIGSEQARPGPGTGHLRIQINIHRSK